MVEVGPEGEIIPSAINPFSGYGPFLVASQRVGAAPGMDAKYYAGTQTMDEARHVEVLSRYPHDRPSATSTSSRRSCC